MLNLDGVKLGLKITWRVLIINTLLCVFKLIAGVMGKSTAMVADAVHSISDTVATLIVIIGLKISSKEADEEHPYGHERFEPICAKIISIILLITGFIIAYGGIKSLIIGQIETPDRIALIAAAVSIAVKESMYWITIIIAKKIKSISMEADAWHHRSDAFSSIGTFVGIFGARMGLTFLDPIAGIVVSFFIIKVGMDFYLRSVRELVDQSADKETIERIKECLESTSDVKSIKEIKTRIFGNKIYVDIEVAVDENMTVKEGHDIAEYIHDYIEISVGNIKHCTVHIEPFGG